MTGIHTIGQRVIVSDVQESLFWVRYRRNENQLIIFADDTYPRWVTTACLLDYDTMASADKFGNISIVSTECVGRNTEYGRSGRHAECLKLHRVRLNRLHLFYCQVRLPPNTSDDVDEDPTGNKALWDRGLLNGASQKVKAVCVYFLRSTLRCLLAHLRLHLNFYFQHFKVQKFKPLQDPGRSLIGGLNVEENICL